MKSYKRVVAGAMAVIFMMVSIFGCSGVSQTKLDKASKYMSKAVTYLTWAEAIVGMVGPQLSKNEKVQKALDATKKAIDAVKVAMEVARSGLEKDEQALATSLAMLVTATFALVRAVEDVKNSR